MAGNAARTRKQRGRKAVGLEGPELTMKLDVSEVLYDSSSSVSSDSAASSQSSRVSHDFLSSIAAAAATNSYAPSSTASNVSTPLSTHTYTHARPYQAERGAVMQRCLCMYVCAMFSAISRGFRAPEECRGKVVL